MNTLQQAALFIVLLSGLWILLSIPAARIYSLCSNRLNRFEPISRARLLRLIALTPLLVAALISVGLIAAPSALVGYHCHEGECLAHTPDSLDIAFFPLLLISLCCVPVLSGFIKNIRSTLALQKNWSAVSTPSDGYRRIELEQPLACTVGFLKSVVYLSKGLIDYLSPPGLAVVLAHERAHAARYDNAWLALARLATLCWYRRMDLLDALELASEQACDRSAALAIGDELIVADTLIKCQRLMQSPQMASSFMRGQLDARVRHLLEPAQKDISLLALLCLVSVPLLAGMGAVTPLHYLFEVIPN